MIQQLGKLLVVLVIRAAMTPPRSATAQASGKGWFLLLRLYSPEESFFTKKWRPTEIELVP